jgi:antitoxin (DNA-binding transcriptional repressor) of toxin-antitoxin stability system
MARDRQPEEISLSKLRRDLPEIVSRMQVLGESFRVMKNGRQFALLTPINDGGKKIRAVRKKLASDPDKLLPAEDVLGTGTAVG